MTNPTSTDFSSMTVAFLTDYLPFQRGCSHNTVLSYRDTMKLFLRFLVKEKSIDLKRFSLKDLSKDLVIEFLKNYQDGGASHLAANQRLAALKSFCEYATTEKPECLDRLLEIRNIKSKKAPGRIIKFLSAEQTALLLKQPEARSRQGLRHKVVLTLLYDAGCRVQELCDLTVGDISICGKSSTVKLHGKGAKDRTVLISEPTADLLSHYLERFHKRSLATDPLIAGRYGEKLKRNGVSYIVEKYGREAARLDSSFPGKVHCHMLRHSKAMHLLQAGVNIVIIRDFLGHQDIDTTMAYVRADNRTKEEVISKVMSQLGEALPAEKGRKEQDLMDFLDGLK